MNDEEQNFQHKLLLLTRSKMRGRGNASSNYSVTRELGSGSYGCVYRAMTAEGEQVAIKECTVKSGCGHIGIVSLKELHVLSAYNHPYVLRMQDLISPKDCQGKPQTVIYDENGLKCRSDKYLFVLPLAEYSLYDLIYSPDEFIIAHLKRVMYQVASGLYFLHVNGIVHRDLKPDNVLLFYPHTEYGAYVTAKLSDFGMSRHVVMNEKNTTTIMTQPYAPPEILFQHPHYDASCDVWALGCTFYEMVMKRHLFYSKNPYDHINNIFKILGTPSREVMNRIGCTASFKETWKPSGFRLYHDHFDHTEVAGLSNPGRLSQFRDLLMRMLKIDPRERITMWEVLQHPFFAGVDPNDQKQRGIIKQLKLDPPDIKYTLPKWTKNSLEIFRYNLSRISNLLSIDSNELDTAEIYWKSMFLGLDIYYRVCDSGEFASSKVDIQLITLSCLYMGYKYYFDETAPKLYELSNSKSLTEKAVKRLPYVEKRILTTLKRIIYRPTVYERIRDVKSVTEDEVEKIFILMTDEEKIYDKSTLSEIVSAWLNTGTSSGRASCASR